MVFSATRRGLVEDTRDIGLIMEAHLGLESHIVSPNAVLRWMNVRVRGIDTAIRTTTSPDCQPWQVGTNTYGTTRTEIGRFAQSNIRR